MKPLWTRRELDIIQSLTWRVRLLSLDQIARIWWPDVASRRIVRRRLRRLATAGLVDVTVINAHPLLNPEHPLVRWNPGDDDPDFQQVAIQTQSRWKASAVPQEVCSATKRAANLFGSTAGRLPPMIHRDHDLLLGHAYVHYRTSRPTEAACWVGEDVRPKAGYRIKDPDAFLVDKYGNVTRVVESAGRYGASQVESFHEFCAQRALAYELW
jgi:hypothetical protein